MTLRKKSRPAPVPNVEDSDTASVFDETHDIPVLDPARVNRKVLGVKRKQVEGLEGELVKRKLLRTEDNKSCSREETPGAVTGLRVEELPTVAEELITVKELVETRPVAPVAVPVPKSAPIARIFPTEATPKDYVFTIKPLMGAPFEIRMTSDSSIFDLKDAIFAKIGMVPEMQLLSHSRLAIPFEEEEKFLDELPIPLQCTLNLTVKAATGISQLNMLGFEDVDEEEYLVYDVVQGAGLENSDSDEENAAGKFRVRIALPPSVATANLPFPVLDSYLRGRSVEDLAETEESSEEPLRSLGNLSSLQICSDPESPVKAAPVATVVVAEESKAPGRCGQCGRKCRLALQFKCRCEGTYCQTHRYGDQHGCKFDYQSHDRARLQESNPKVFKSQLEKF
ncbi:hypothetical protein PSACC_03716 [Paramicrosporidium saccamoebae]|uniref:AN1-type domain-containing protein n=1 Tax=Paramicrosporidium saccamoebae TaxID=1246581 RepID=A0A2H9TFF9_9FUNG|nr:hypothetical protein PSACC_03716 [Paramicrosporidium saccamoebae]